LSVLRQAAGFIIFILSEVREKAQKLIFLSKEDCSAFKIFTSGDTPGNMIIFMFALLNITTAPSYPRDNRKIFLKVEAKRNMSYRQP